MALLALTLSCFSTPLPAHLTALHSLCVVYPTGRVGVESHAYVQLRHRPARSLPGTFVGGELTDYSGGIAGYDGPGGHILGHDTPGSHYSPLTNPHPFQND